VAQPFRRHTPGGSSVALSRKRRDRPMVRESARRTTKKTPRRTVPCYDNVMPELTVIRAVCPHDCPDTCSMLVTVQDGKAIALRGDLEHSFTRGFLCQKVARYLDRVYHPERLLYPMVRTGP
jgi:anaerobic selenocysteine-containing dehydrogenase